MTLTVARGKNGRLYTRRFDYDEAIARHAAGESIRELADAYGVSWTAVQRVVVPGVDERQLEASRRYRAGTCEECGGPAMRLTGAKIAHNPDGRNLCRPCRNRAKRTAVRFDGDGSVVAVKCFTCEQWLVPETFPKGTRYHDLRPGGFHNACRPCQTKLRQDYRERHKIPCDRCGAPRLPASESNTLRLGNNDTGLCLACYRDDLRQKTSFGASA